MKRLSQILLPAILALATLTARPATAAEEPQSLPEAKEQKSEDQPKTPPAQPDPPASHVEIDPLPVKFEQLSSICLHTSGNLLACDVKAAQIKVIRPDGTVAATLRPGFGPEAIDVATDGTIYCGGQGRLARLDLSGKVLVSVEGPEDLVPSDKDTDESEPQRRPPRRRVSGITVTNKDVFVAIGSGRSTRALSNLYRLDRNLANPKLLLARLRGCCQRCDVTSREGKVYLAENAAYRVLGIDREGKVLGKWGHRDRKNIEGFGSCCNPMNLAFDAAGILYTAESGLGRVKRYTTDGEFLGLVGSVGVDRFNRASSLAAACSNIAIAVTPDARLIYVMDFKNNQIRVLKKK